MKLKGIAADQTQKEKIGFVDLLIRIPTSDNYPSLNLSHSCGIILYEIFKKINNIFIGRGKNPVLLANKEDRQYLYKTIYSLMKRLKIREYREENMLFAFKNIFERTFMSRKELSLITGLYSKIESILKELDIYKV